MPETYVTSDLHLFHKNILKYQPDTRQFNSVEEMNETIVERWNETVKPNDTIYDLGDFALAGVTKVLTILPRLNGKKIHIMGNHDHKSLWKKKITDHFEWVGDYKRIHIDGRVVVMFHYPIHTWEMKQYGSIHLYGHMHGTGIPMENTRSMDVGVDTNNFYPYNIQEVFKIIDNIYT